VTALGLILSGDAEVWGITLVSMQVTVAALLLAAGLALPLGARLAVARGRAARSASWLLHTSAGLPTVVVGLTLYFLLSASGPLGWMDLLYTRTAMILGQTVLAIPILATLVSSAVAGLPREAFETARTLGFSGLRRLLLLLLEVRPALASAMLVAFGRIFTELGAALILGGNIRHQTRTLTTAIALEHTKGEDARAIALGMILLLVALAVNGVVHGAALRRRPA